MQNKTKKELYDLNKIGPVLSLEPVFVNAVITDVDKHEVNPCVLIGIAIEIHKYTVIQKNGLVNSYQMVQHYEPDQTPKTVHMEYIDIVKLVDNGYFFHHIFQNEDGPIYNPTIKKLCGDVYVDCEPLSNFCGYSADVNGEVKPFTKEVKK